MRLAVVVNRFPSVSETFIFNKVAGLRAAGVDVTVVSHSYSNDLALFADGLKEDPTEYVTYSATAGGRKALPGATGRLACRQPARALQLWKQAQERYGRGRRALKAWVMALPLAAGKYDLIHFEYSGLAVSYVDALPLLSPSKLLTSCRGAAEQITPLAEPERAAKLEKVFRQVDLVHCVSADMLRTVQRYVLRYE